MNSNHLVLIVKRVVCAGAVMAVGLLSTLAVDAAPRADDVPSVTVKYGDLNLATSAGAQRLYRRIVIAAERVCPTEGTRDLNRLAHVRACRADAIARAVQAVNNAQLAAVHEQSAHRS
ncbi:MAG: UrcA family protein [Steroidobacter sp.]